MRLGHFVSFEKISFWKKHKKIPQMKSRKFWVIFKKSCHSKKNVKKHPQMNRIFCTIYEPLNGMPIKGDSNRLCHLTKFWWGAHKLGGTHLVSNHRFESRCCYIRSRLSELDRSFIPSVHRLSFCRGVIESLWHSNQSST